MLFDTYTKPDSRETLRSVLDRRVTYLESRAEAVSARQTEPAAGDWRQPLVAATLWLEAAEGAIALGKFNDGRRFLRQSVQRLLDLGLPFGAALQKTLFPQDEELSSSSEAIVQAWRTHIDKPEVSEMPAKIGESLLVVAHESPTQWAYFALADTGTDSQDAASLAFSNKLHSGLQALRSAQLGRLRLPLEHYVSIAEFSAFAIRYHGDVGEERLTKAAEIIATSLFGLYRSVKWASSNTYLWNRMLAPAPLFDFDTAMLITRVLEVPEMKVSQMVLENVYASINSDARNYAREYVDVVQQFRKNNPESIQL